MVDSSMKPFREIEYRSSDLVCSGCGTCSMSVYLRCDVADQECFSIASCRRCGRQYHAEILPTFQERYQAVQRTVKHAPCPVCRARPRTVRYLCDRVMQQCFFLLACPSCGDLHTA